MFKRIFLIVFSSLFLPLMIHAQDGKTVLENTARGMGVTELKSIKYSGSGYNFAVGQNVNPAAPWPRFNVKSYTRTINFDASASREEMVRTQGENPPRGGGGQPMIGEQRQELLVSGNYAWNLAGGNATPARPALEERQLQIWLRIVPLHGRVVPIGDLLKAIGKAG